MRVSLTTKTKDNNKIALIISVIAIIVIVVISAIFIITALTKNVDASVISDEQAVDFAEEAFEDALNGKMS